ncbi:colicin immunity domain-containing protein [Streptomyces sp. NPDC029003]|uniref:colicin immunity domain-containing protein n=1 Tax=Streptomyces sp. NPDC029003 TaxID=3155125 RepID=UPI003403170B
MVTDSGAGDRSEITPRTRLRMWKTVGEIPPDSAIGHQLTAMRELSRGDIQPQEFATSWLASRRRSLREGERIGEQLSRRLDQIFYALDDYPIDPSLREPGDVTDAELIEKVNAVLADFGLG